MEIVFVADIADDVDDAVAIEYLQRLGVLKCTVLDGKSNDAEREKRLTDLGVVITDAIPSDTKIIFCGGALTKVAEYVKTNKLDVLVANGGYAGANVVPFKEQLDKFKNKSKIRTYNFNLDVDAALSVLSSPNIKDMLFVSKNVCHSERNTRAEFHAADSFLDDYKIDGTKRLHDLLMVKEGINFLNNEKMTCKYGNANLVCDRQIPDNMSRWSSVLNPYSKVQISVGFNN